MKATLAPADKSTFGSEARRLRINCLLTQQDLADRMGVRQQTVSEWETGLHLPRYSTSKHLNLIAQEVKFSYQVQDTAGPAED